MKQHNRPSFAQSAVIIAVISLFLIWFKFHFSDLTSTQNGTIRFTLGTIFALLILIRSKPEESEKLSPKALPSIIGAVLGAGCVLFGIIFTVNQVEWLGLILLIFSCLRWALPGRYSRDVFFSALLFYWIHPLPGQVFGPLQLFMQKASVIGSEWLLHMINVRAWADGLILRTGESTFEIPAWCSGMRTATTVFLLSLGLCVLKRIKIFESILITFAALAQALILNILRITVMVALTDNVKDKGGFEFLHNTTWLIVIAAVLLVYIEINLWRNYRRHRKETKHEMKPRAERVFSLYPSIWRFTIYFKHHIILYSILIFLIGGLIYKSRQHHRSEMIKTVAEMLRDNEDLENAQRCAEAVLEMTPGDREWRLTIIRMLIMQGKYGDVLDRLDDIQASDRGQVLEKDILRAYSLMGEGKVKEASDIVETFPEEMKSSNPFVAMILTELGFFGNDPEQVEKYIVTAASWGPNISRVRALYPYLRAHRKWEAMADSNYGVPFTDPKHALSASEAYMNMNRGAALTSIMLDSIKKWPTDPRLLEPLYFLTIRDIGSEWETRFARHLSRCIRIIENPDGLNTLFDKCFEIYRPDLAWLIYRRIEYIDPAHPTLPMCAARFGSQWFTFRKRFLGIGASSDAETIDLKPFFLLGNTMEAWRLTCGDIPLGSELAVPDVISARKKLLQSAIAEFRKRAALPAGDPLTLSLPMWFAYVGAREINNEPDNARDLLLHIAEQYPEQKNKTLIVESEMYERRNDWQSVYETLRTYLIDYDGKGTIHINNLLRLCRAQLNLKLGLGAHFTASETYRLFPHSTQAKEMVVTTLDMLSGPEEALFTLTQDSAHHERRFDAMELKLLYMTQRFSEIRPFCETTLLPVINVHPYTPQDLFLPPAELSVMWHHVSLLSEKQFADTAKTLQSNLGTATSPFFKKMIPLWLEEYRGSSFAKASEDKQESEVRGQTIEKWMGCGRDRIEKATALNQLTLLLLRKEKYKEARIAAQKAAELFPESPTLWHILISLSNADPKIIKQARKACPSDPNIFLAGLIAREQSIEIRSQKSEIRKKENTKHSSLLTSDLWPLTSEQQLPYSVAAVTRAADFLYKKGHKKEAAILMKQVTPKARGLLPAHILGIKCALAENNKPWAIECTRSSISSSLQPQSTFYKQMVQLKVDKGAVSKDMETVDALRNLRKAEPDNAIWSQMLGYIRFQRKGWELVDSMYQMMAAIDSGATNMTPYVIAAEASRRLGNHERATDLLRKGRKQLPGDTAILNNLVYTLATTPKRVADNTEEILKLIPELSKVAGHKPEALDTITAAYIHANQTDKAQTTINKLLKLVKEGSLTWFQAKMHVAEIQLLQDKPEEAVETLKIMFKHSHGIPDEDILDANRLMKQAREVILSSQRPVTSSR